MFAALESVMELVSANPAEFIVLKGFFPAESAVFGTRMTRLSEQVKHPAVVSHKSTERP